MCFKHVIMPQGSDISYSIKQKVLIVIIYSAQRGSRKALLQLLVRSTKERFLGEKKKVSCSKMLSFSSSKLFSVSLSLN